MKKIMFNNTYGLNQAVKQGTKTMTHRVLNLSEEDEAWLDHTFDWDLCESDILDRYAQYKVGEVVAVAESYKDIIGDRVFLVSYETGVSVHRSIMEREKGWSNKQNVASEFMPTRILFTDRWIERLQNISEADCLKEGIIDMITPVLYPCGNHVYTFEGNKGGAWYGSIQGYITARIAFSHLIDKVSKKGTWERNPWTIAYTFELVKGGQQ